MTRLKRRGRYSVRLSMPGQLPELELVADGATEVVLMEGADRDAEGDAEADGETETETDADAEGEGSVEAPLPLSVTKEAMAGPGNV